MRYAVPEMLNWLWLTLPLFAFLVWAQRHRQARLRRFAAPQLLDQLIADYDSARARLKDFLLVLVFIFGVVALARPQWGYEMQEIKRQGLDILIVLDVSRSMLTEDVKPNRLERAKLAVRDMLKDLRGDRVGLIAFSGEAFLACPLTVDYSGFLLSLADLGTDSIPRGGTNISRALEEAITEYDNTPSKYKAVIVLTDGENLEDDPRPVVRKAQAKGIKIYCVGVGTQEGELIRLKDPWGKDTFFKDENGNYVKSRLNESLLQKIALTTGGIYVRASGAETGLDIIYNQELAKFEKRDIEAKMERQYHERLQIPLAVAIVLLVVETCLPVRRDEGKDTRAQDTATQVKP